MASTNEEIIVAVNSFQDEAIRILSEMVKFDSTLNNEHDVQEYCATLFSTYLGYQVDRFRVDLEALKHVRGVSPVDWKYDEKKENVIGLHKSKTKKGHSLIFNGRIVDIDVVPVDAGVDQWSAPPFHPVVRDGRLYGRGAGDMKAGIVCFVIALKALEKLGWRPAADVILQTVVEEECTGNGTLACLERGYKAELALIPEPFPFLITAQLGVMWFRVRVQGKPVHAMEAGSGINAIDAAYFLYNELRKVESRWNDADLRHPAYTHMKHPVNFNFGVISGGDWPSSVPSACQFDVRVGFFPGVTIESVKKEIEAALVRASEAHPSKIHYEISYRGFQAEGCVLDPNTPGLKLLQSVHKQVLHRDMVLEAVTCTTDARHFALYHNIPTTCYGPEAKSIHGIDESVSIASMMEVARVFAVFVRDWCGLEHK